MAVIATFNAKDVFRDKAEAVKPAPAPIAPVESVDVDTTLPVPPVVVPAFPVEAPKQ